MDGAVPSISLGAEAYHRSPTVRKQVSQPGDDNCANGYGW